ncbi:VOC family protein [Gordonia sp. PKS22-38]|uniref:VOC family protein n=1 Tax=Gordonia prachuapensis TaxID=3115651 RepID=A0ABU7MZ39_9ACTN|nr:VOC family protein [Gordonia sp. PKS22-38]
MRIRWLTAFLDFPTDQFGAEVTFWRAIAGSTVSPPRGERREFASLEPFNGDPHLRVQRVDDGPGGIHLDLHVEDLGAATEEAIRLGATTIRAEPGDGYVTMTSPAGFVFCLVDWQGESERSRPIRWPGDTISIIDQVCIDVPHDAFESETDFWERLTGRPTTSTSRPELVRLARDPALPIGILLQRRGREDTTATASGHLDLAATAVEDEVARHADWGAEVVERFENWTVMRDPVGRRYCITSRNPRTGD